AMGGGLPLGASVGRKEVIEGIQVPTPPTFACHSLACAAGLKALEILERDRLWENAARRGAYFLKRFTELKQYHRLIGDVRFKGLMGGVELVKDDETKQPAVDESKKIVKKCMEHGVLTMVAGLTGSVMRIQPPLTVSEEHAEMVVDAFDKALAAVEKGQD
ncbi:MAG: aminotransferase class III-fold pyridoxal phosphate-dependent enzyme, partial [Candidatus Bathyarchaeia archaeon]